ncbi:MAG TPA: hypothetical protein RMH99_11425 [Sandaracinaceae bacterium LLY-WYZ-13_1]|nr:hypothetical protein [Sandaracinaceae bacterium LLY-WYZ-13_1]
MRTSTELAGWGLLALVWLLPFGALGTLIAWLEGDLPLGGFLLGLLALSALPRLVLSARRLREPRPEEQEAADGRAPVLVLHGFTPTSVPLWRRLSAFQPALWRDWTDHLTLRALRAGLRPHGPVRPLARPAPPPPHGPVASRGHPAHERRLDRALRAAARVVIALDGSEACVAEVDRAVEAVGLRRVVLLTPHRPDASFGRTWDALRARWPDLPAHDRRIVAIAFGKAGAPQLYQLRFASFWTRRAALKDPGTLLPGAPGRPAPRAPSTARLLPFVPLAAAVFAAVAVPLLLDLADARVTGDRPLGFGLGVLAVGVILALLARRAIQLIPANEAVMVLVASAPWWLPELLSEGGASYALRSELRGTAWGAAYAAPLLFGTGLTLAGGSLIRKSPGRSPAYAIFGAAALLPVAALAWSATDHDGRLATTFLALLAGAAVLALAVVAASGDGRRAHAPLPLGAAVAGVLGVAAWLSVVSHRGWRELVGTSEGASAELLRRAEEAEALAQLGEALPWFVWVVPLVVALVAIQFRGRATHVSIGNAAALLPLAFVLALSARTEGWARAHVEAHLAGLDDRVFATAGGDALAPRIEPPRLRAPVSPGPVDVVVEPRGAVIDGARVALPVQLATGAGSTPALDRALAARVRADRPIRIGVDRRADAAMVAGVVRAALSQGAPRAELVFRDPSGLPAGVAFGPRWLRVDGVERYLVIRHDGVELRSAIGGSRRVPDRAGRVDATRLDDLLAELQRIEPHRRDVVLVAAGGVNADRLARVATTAGERFERLALADRAR